MQLCQFAMPQRCHEDRVTELFYGNGNGYKSLNIFAETLQMPQRCHEDPVAELFDGNR